MLNLNQITVPVSDVARSIRFYEMLGLQLIVSTPPRYARFECLDGDATFSLHRAEKPVSNEHGIWVYFEVQELDSYINRLIEQGITIDEMPEDKPWLWREARLKDPDNNQLILYFAGHNRKNPPWRI